MPLLYKIAGVLLPSLNLHLSYKRDILRMQGEVMDREVRAVEALEEVVAEVGLMLMMMVARSTQHLQDLPLHR